MNDRFKFRYWHTKENKYINTQCDCLAICNSCLQSIRDIPDVRGWYNTILDQTYNDFELIPEQCTEFSDKNGNLIYEGDVIKDRGGIKYQIMWKDARFVAVAIKEFDYMPDNLLNQKWIDVWKYEIIGNIHEQAEQKE